MVHETIREIAHRAYNVSARIKDESKREEFRTEIRSLIDKLK
jgi:hypothetical protein